MGNWDKSDFWRLQTLTPLDILADYNDAWDDSWFRNQLGAPVESDGTPVYYRVPESFESAKNDGERWRWALAKAAEVDPGLAIRTRLELAGFLFSQFGTQTIADAPFGRTRRRS